MDDEALFEEACGCCKQPLGEGGDHLNWLYLSKKAEWDYPATGNVLYDIPAEYAMTLVCDECIEGAGEGEGEGGDDVDPEWVLKGEEFEHVPVEELEDIQPMSERIAEIEAGEGGEQRGEW